MTNAKSVPGSTPSTPSKPSTTPLDDATAMGSTADTSMQEVSSLNDAAQTAAGEAAITGSDAGADGDGAELSRANERDHGTAFPLAEESENCSRNLVQAWKKFLKLLERKSTQDLLESLRKKKQERDREKEELKRQLSIGTQHLQLVEEELHEEERNLVEVGKMDKKATGLERIVQKMDQKCKDLDRKKVELERRKIYTGKQLPFGHVIKHVQKEQDRVERKVGNLKRKRDEVAERQSKLKQEVEVGREMCQRAREAVKERVNTLRRQLAEASARIEQLEVEDDIVEVASLRGLLK